jgi:hypothetical protein
MLISTNLVWFKQNILITLFVRNIASNSTIFTSIFRVIRSIAKQLKGAKNVIYYFKMQNRSIIVSFKKYATGSHNFLFRKLKK